MEDFLKTRGLGWRSDDEDHDLIASTALRTFGRPVLIPPKIDPRRWLRIEDQKQTSSCVGHAGSSAAEVIYWFATRKVIQLSRWFAYISAQMENGLVGRDAGAMISGLMTSAKKRGMCKEELCPFTGRYFYNLSSEAKADAETRQIRSHVELREWQDAKDWIGGKMGSIVLGVPVGPRYSQCTGKLKTVDASGGGHAIAMCGYDEDDDGEFLWHPGSWGERHGENGWIRVYRGPYESWANMGRRTEMLGFSDMEAPTPRWDDLIDMVDWA